MATTIDSAIDKIIDRQDQIKKNNKQREMQRRNTVNDSKSDFKTMLRGNGKIYTGYEITRDLQFIMRYTFNLHIRPYVTSIAQTVTTSEKSLTTDGKTISPNPHSHEVNLGIEMNEHEFDTSKLRMIIQDIDVTDAIIAEYGSFIDGYGYFPSQDGVYDILRIIDYFPTWQQAEILGHGRKEIQITQEADSLCECEISSHIKYNHIDRGGLS